MIPRNVSESLGSYVAIKAYLDANHEGNMENKRLPIICYSKLQNTVEASSFG